MSMPCLLKSIMNNTLLLPKNFKCTHLKVVFIFAILWLCQSCKEKTAETKTIDLTEIKKKINLPYTNLNLQTINDPIKIATELGFKKVEKLSENEVRYTVWPPEDEEEEWSYLKKISDSVFLHQNEGDVLYSKLALEDSLQWKVYTRIDQNGNATEYTRLKYTMKDHMGSRYFRRGTWGISWTSILWLYYLKDEVSGKELPTTDIKWLHTVYVGFRKKDAPNDLPKIAYETIQEDYKYTDESAECKYQKAFKTETDLFTLYGLVVDHDNFWEANY